MDCSEIHSWGPITFHLGAAVSLVPPSGKIQDPSPVRTLTRYQTCSDIFTLIWPYWQLVTLFSLSSWNLCRSLFLSWCRGEYLKYELLNSLRPFCLSTMRLSSHSTTLPFFLPSFLNTGFTSTSVQRVLGHSECLCSKLEGVKQSCGHAVTTLFPIGPQSICL